MKGILYILAAALFATVPAIAAIRTTTARTGQSSRRIAEQVYPRDSVVVEEIKVVKQNIEIIEAERNPELGETASPMRSKHEKIYTAVDEQASFPGGMTAMMKYLASAVRYPEIAQEKGASGRVIIQFVVYADGSIRDVKILRSIEPSLDKEAVRVVKAMPKWIPGKINGAPVSSYYTIPITFRM